MPRSQDFQSYGFANLHWALREDGLTNVMTPTGQIVMVVAYLPIPDSYLDRMAINQLVSEFRAGPGRNATKAICSKCHDEENYVVWDLKPTTLKRHLYHHFSIKCFQCLLCLQQFLTKDQAVVHAMGHHMQSKDRKAAVDYVLEL